MYAITLAGQMADFLSMTLGQASIPQPAMTVNLAPDAPEDASLVAQNLVDMQQLWEDWHDFNTRDLRGEQVKPDPTTMLLAKICLVWSLFPGAWFGNVGKTPSYREGGRFRMPKKITGLHAGIAGHWQHLSGQNKLQTLLGSVRLWINTTKLDADVQPCVPGK